MKMYRILSNLKIFPYAKLVLLLVLSSSFLREREERLQEENIHLHPEGSATAWPQ
jgi:hypothetical protein